MNLDELVKRFKALASKNSLTKAEQKEARDLMRELKKAGVANGEISELSSGKWSPSTIKYYTPGIKPLHPNEWDSAVKLLNAMIASGLSLDHVETAVAISDQLQVAGVSLSQLVDLFFAPTHRPWRRQIYVTTTNSWSNIVYRRRIYQKPLA